MTEIIRDCTSPDFSKSLRTLIEESDKEYADKEAVLLITVDSADGECLCTITKVTETVAQGDAILEFIDQYAYDLLDKIKGMFTANETYLFTVVQYLPKLGVIRRHAQGQVFTKTIH